MKPTQITIPSSFTTAATSLLARLTGASSSGVELVYTPHSRWPLPRATLSIKDTLRISVLDSSFNPPTLAHLALAKVPTKHVSSNVTAYDARLLLLSVRNADKPLKQGDATYLQRLEMMYLLVKDIEEPLPHPSHHQSEMQEEQEEWEGQEGERNVAVAIIDEPTFIGKSTTLLAFLRSRLSSFSPSPTPTPRLTFLLGIDTLERLFSPRYYPSQSEHSMLTSLHHFFGSEQEGEGSEVVCARRDPSSYPPAPTNLTNSNNSVPVPDSVAGIPMAIPHSATEFILANQIKLIDIGAEEQAFSSSKVRSGRLALRSSAQGEGWKGMVSWRIGKYVEERGLYLG